MVDDGTDLILCTLRRCKLLNSSTDRVKVTGRKCLYFAIKRTSIDNSSICCGRVTFCCCNSLMGKKYADYFRQSYDIFTSLFSRLVGKLRCKPGIGSVWESLRLQLHCVRCLEVGFGNINTVFVQLELYTVTGHQKRSSYVSERRVKKSKSMLSENDMFAWSCVNRTLL